MIIKNLKIFSQNVCKNQFLTKLILENNKNVNIIFIQEPSWSINFLACHLKKIKKLLASPITCHGLYFQDTWSMKKIILELSHIAILNSLNNNFHLERTL